MLRTLVGPFAALAIATTAACTDATGTVQGGELLITDPCSTDAPSTWTSLYTCYFGPSGVASCTAQTSCHGASSQLGSQVSGFVCGGSKASCWQGMTQQVDGGLFPPIVCLSALGCSGGVSDPTKTTLWGDLHQSSASNGQLDNMPCGDPAGTPIPCHADTATYTFTSDDLARISSWITQGGQDN